MLVNSREGVKPAVAKGGSQTRFDEGLADLFSGGDGEFLLDTIFRIP
jgi:hypothetical protein